MQFHLNRVRFVHCQCSEARIHHNHGTVYSHRVTESHTLTFRNTADTTEQLNGAYEWCIAAQELLYPIFRGGQGGHLVWLHVMLLHGVCPPPQECL